MAIELLAHRGWWEKPGEKNTPAAVRRAFAAGLGIETDLRDCAGEIVISHDPPIESKDNYLLRDLLGDYVQSKCAGTLALNIKADGLQQAVKALLIEFGVTRYFVFDMSIPDALQWAKQGCRLFSRQSEYEPVPALTESAAGIWLDCFKTDWFGSDVIKGHLDVGKHVAVVSPELHGRDPRKVWAMLHSFESPNIGLCTDLITQARSFFNGQN